jgi:hypothetical protein
MDLLMINKANESSFQCEIIQRLMTVFWASAKRL